ncbi:hypothetical protein [Flaviramulus basaltis]|nr:hypothetical protein [Flaviramulus basaltis]
MTKIFKKYLSLIVILFLTGASNLYANSIAEHCDDYFLNTSQISINENLETPSYNPIQQQEENKLFFDIVEIENTENEESISKNNIIPFGSYIAAFFEAQIFNVLSFQLQKNSLRKRNGFNQYSTRLHLRLEVFII